MASAQDYPFSGAASQPFPLTGIINVASFGVVGSGLAAPFGGSMVSGSATLTLINTIESGHGDANFSPLHVGYKIVVPFAGPGATDLYTTIATYVSPTQVTLSATNSSGSNVSKVDVFWWPSNLDCTVGLQQAINSAVYGNVVYLPPGVYPITNKLTNSPLLCGILGNGFNNTFIVNASATNANPILSFTDCPWGFQIKGLGMKGRGQGAPGTENIVELLVSQTTGIFVGTIDNIRTLDGPGSGLYIQCAVASTISNSLFDDVTGATGAGLFLDVNPINMGGGTSVTMQGCYSYDNVVAYKFNNYSYSHLSALAADSNVENYYFLNCQNMTATGCGSEVALFRGGGDPGTGYILDGSNEISLYNCYWTQVPNVASVGIVLRNGSTNCVIEGFQSKQPFITPNVDVNVGSGVTNTVFRNCKFSATTQISDSGTNTAIFTNGGYSKIQGATFFGSPIPSSAFNTDLGSDALPWANTWSGNFQSFTDYRIRANGTLKWSSTSDPSGTADTGISRDSAGTIFFGNGTQDDKSAVICANLAQMKRFDAKWSTTLTAGAFSLSGGWGGSATVSITPNTTSKDHGGAVTINASGTTGANPTVTLNFVDGGWGNAPVAVPARGDGNAPATAYWVCTSTATGSATFTFIGTPNSGTSYVLNYILLGT